MRTIAVCNALHDATTEYLAAWSEKIKEKAAQRGDVLFLELRADEVNRASLETLLTDEKPRLVVMHCHGVDDGIADFEYKILVKADVNAEIFKEKIVHSLSCQTGKILGPRCVQVGTSAYIGYMEDFKFLGDDTYLGNKKNDPVASFFLDPAFEVVMGLIEGDTVEMAFNKSQTMLKRKLLETITNQTKLNNQISPLLFHNLKHQQAFGDLSAIFN